MKVDNAIIMAAGTSSRFAPLSYERPKALIEVRGEVLIEREIRQLQEAGVKEIVVVTGYMAEQFEYLREKFGVRLIHNPSYLSRNNNSSIHAARAYLGNSYICSSDNYFSSNPFERDVDESYYAAVFAKGPTNEWCISEENGWIQNVTIGGCDSYIMLGHVFWSSSFSQTFLRILEKEYDLPETARKLWESIYIEHIRELPMKIRKYPDNCIFEFDTLDELREFDSSYITDTRSRIIKQLADKLGCKEADIRGIAPARDASNAADGFEFEAAGRKYVYRYESEELRRI